MSLRKRVPQIAITGWLSIFAPACSSHADKSPHSKDPMHAHAEYDFLLSNMSTRELYAAHVDDGPDDVALVRSALQNDARPQVRRNAIVALTASMKDGATGDYVAALSDPAPEVLTEAAASLATYAEESTGRPKNHELVSKLREHAAELRHALSSTDTTVRYNAARALTLIDDSDVDLAALLADPAAIVRGVALDLAVSRRLGPADVKSLGILARSDSEFQLRVRAVTIAVLRSTPELAGPILAEALKRGDVDLSTAQAATKHPQPAALPAMLAHLRAYPHEAAWLPAVAAINAPCSARGVAALLADDISGSAALAALRSLSGKPDATAGELKTWANAQPDDAMPCATVAQK